MFDTNFVAKKIKEARVSKNMTQMDLADAMGVSFQAAKWISQRSVPLIRTEKMGNWMNLRKRMSEH